MGDTDPLSALHSGFLGLDIQLAVVLYILYIALTQTKSRVGDGSGHGPADSLS